MKHTTNDWHTCAPSSQSACSSGCWSFLVVDAAGSVGQIQLSSAAKGLRTTQAKERFSTAYTTCHGWLKAYRG